MDTENNLTIRQIHEQAKQSVNVIYNEFLLNYRPAKNLVYGFVEGKQDPSFYKGLIEHNLPQEWECKVIPSGSKKKVLEVLDAMDWNRFPKRRICFFVDRDLSSFLGGESHAAGNLYITDHYSIENTLATEKIFIRLLEEVCGITGLKADEIDTLEQQFRVNLELFCEKLSCIMAQIIIWRRTESIDPDLRTRLDKIKIMSLFDYNGGKILLHESYEDADTRVNFAAAATGSPPAPKNEREKVEEEFHTHDGPKKYIRGKYLLKFLIDTVVAVQRDLQAILPSNNANPGSPPGIGLANTMMVAGPRCRCPESLRTFITNNYLHFIGNNPLNLQAIP